MTNQTMNYLAHVYLADPTPDSIIGNLLADFIKGNKIAGLPEGIQQGIRLHRQVDAFTDQHPFVQRSICRISSKWSWYSGILIDVYYDHLLATNWVRYADEPLRAFVDRVHRCLSDRANSILPGHEHLPRLIESDRLYSYLSSDGIEDALRLLSRRINERIPSRHVRLEQAVPELSANHSELEEDFHAFFPQLIGFVQDWNARLLPNRRQFAVSELHINKET
jgi:acyl carrier protein phosphodiesterase